MQPNHLNNSRRFRSIEIANKCSNCVYEIVINLELIYRSKLFKYVKTNANLNVTL